MTRSAIGLLIIALAGCAYDPIAVRTPRAMDGGADASDADASGSDAMSDARADGDADGNMDGDIDSTIDSDVPDVHADFELEVVPPSPSATDWNDYVAAEDFAAPCPRVSPPSAQGCVHAGAVRKLALEEASCGGLAAIDEHEWFDWTCSAESGAAVFTGQLRHAVGLAHLIDEAALTWHESSVTVTRDGNTVASTEPAVFWHNPVSALPAADSNVIELKDAGTVYVVTEEPAGDLRISADGVSLLSVDGVRLRTAASSTVVLEVDAGEPAYFLWLENLYVDADEHPAGIDLKALVHSVVRNVIVGRESVVSLASAPDIRIDAAASRLESVYSEAAAGVGIEIEGERNNVLNVRVANAASHGLSLRLTDSLVSGVSVSSAGGDGVRLNGVTATRLEHISVANCDGDGVEALTASHNDTFVDVVAANNGGSGIVLGGNDHRLLLSISASNAIDGIRIDGSHSLLMHSTSVNNEFFGIHVVSGSYAEIINSIVTNNLNGLMLSADSSRSRVHDLWIAANFEREVTIAGGDNLFSGALAFNKPDACALIDTPPSPGLSSNPCVADGATADITYDNPLQTTRTPDDGVLGGQQYESDLANDQTEPNATCQYDDITDWFSFSHRQRNWGRFLESGAFPNADAIGRCEGIATCGYWDWRVSNRGSRLRFAWGADPTVLEDPAHVRTHVWSPTFESTCAFIPGAQWTGGATPACTTALLGYAFEPSDGNGNDNFLCEPDERCIVNRNRGAYPGGDYPSGGTLEALDPGAADGLTQVPEFGAVILDVYNTNGE